MKLTKEVTYNAEIGLFTIPGNSGYSCLGLAVCRERSARLASELGVALPEDIRSRKWESPMALYGFYLALIAQAERRHKATGWRSQSELTPELIGLEHKRVEVVHKWDNGEFATERFWVGKSTGFIPCHLAIPKRNSSGGPAVSLGKIKSVRILNSGKGAL